jgi:uncharacterized protein (DUF924 family)
MIADEILTFWFGSNPADIMVINEKSALWWSKNPETDLEIARRFGDLINSAAVGQLSAWEATPRGRLALILLTDQFPRNVYRNSPQAFAYDAKALSWCLDGLQQGGDRELRLIERVFFYLPLEHAESLACQDRSVEKFRELLDQVDAGSKQTFMEYLDFAVRHRDIIARFGRFPHRNDVLARDSTAEELAFLKEPGSSF